jgi:hypothetical protein
MALFTSFRRRSERRSLLLLCPSLASYRPVYLQSVGPVHFFDIFIDRFGEGEVLS